MNDYMVMSFTNLVDQDVEGRERGAARGQHGVAEEDGPLLLWLDVCVSVDWLDCELIYQQIDKRQIAMDRRTIEVVHFLYRAAMSWGSLL